MTYYSSVRKINKLEKLQQSIVKSCSRYYVNKAMPDVTLKLELNKCLLLRQSRAILTPTLQCRCHRYELPTYANIYVCMFIG